MAWPTTDEPRENFTTVRWTDDEYADVEWLKSITGVKDRSAAIRNAVARVVAAERRRAAKQKGGAG